jgi:hypothetical protein
VTVKGGDGIVVTLEFEKELDVWVASAPEGKDPCR